MLGYELSESPDLGRMPLNGTTHKHSVYLEPCRLSLWSLQQPECLGAMSSFKHLILRGWSTRDHYRRRSHCRQKFEGFHTWHRIPSAFVDL